MDLTSLANATPDTIVHLNYVAFRPAGPIAQEEFAQSRDWDKRPTSYVGNFSSLKVSKKGDLILTLWVHNRGETGAFRAFNLNRGTLRDLKVVTA